MKGALLLAAALSVVEISAFLPSTFSASTPPPTSISTISSRLHEAPVPFAGVGPRNEWTDMSQYDIDDVATIASEWTANLIAKTLDTPERIVLGCRDKSLFVDTIIVILKRRPGEGLGMELQEIAGGRSDGLGITVITGLVEGGCAERCVGEIIRPGDSIASLSVAKESVGNGGTSVEEELIIQNTECLGYDATVEAIQSMPRIKEEDDEEEIVISLKRIRRKPKVKVNLRYPPSQGEPDTTLELFAGENLRLAMLVRGVKLNDPLAKRFDTKNGGNCGAGGLCRTCAVSVLRGADVLSPPKLSEKQMLSDQPRWRLACRSFVGYGMKEGEVTVMVSPRQWGVDSEEWS